MARTVTAPPDSRCAFESCVRGGLNQPRGVRPIHIRTRAIVARCRNEAEAAAAATNPGSETTATGNRQPRACRRRWVDVAARTQVSTRDRRQARSPRRAGSQYGSVRRAFLDWDARRVAQKACCDFRGVRLSDPLSDAIRRRRTASRRPSRCGLSSGARAARRSRRTALVLVRFLRPAEDLPKRPAAMLTTDLGAQRRALSVGCRRDRAACAGLMLVAATDQVW